ncbi:MAG TPA: hypothetical protein VGK29_23710 [Paludibaculum sp.]|jgi:hypothetical protein
MERQRGNNSFGGLMTALALVPPLILALLVAHYVVDVPYFDQWAFSALGVYFRNGGQDFGPLFSQHNEARMLFPTLVNLACEYLSSGDVRVCAAAAMSLAGLSLFNIHRLVVLTLPDSVAARSAVTLLASIMIFSPVQWENWLWGNQIALFFPAACLTTAICAACSELRFGVKLGVCAGLAFVATFSFPNGILCWVVLLPLLVWQPADRQGRILAAAGWLAAAVGSIGLYFQGFLTTAGHASWAESFAKPLILVFSFMGFLGAPLASGGEIWLYRSGRLISLALLGLLAVACLALMMGRSRLAWQRAGGWLVLCAFVLGSAGVTALGRSTMSSVFLHDSRYTSFSIYLVIGLAGLLAVVRAEWPEPGRRATLPVAVVLCVGVLGLHVSASVQSVPAMAKWRTARLQSKACLAMINVGASPCAITKLGPAYSQVLTTANALNVLGLLHPPLLHGALLPAERIAAAPLNAAEGKLAGLRRLPDGSWIASGSAVLPGRGEPADGVVITYEAAKGAPQVVALADTPTPASGWVQWFVLPEDAATVRAYAYDALEGRLYPLNPALSVAGQETAPIRFGAEANGALDRLARGYVNFPDPREPMMAFGWAFLPKEAKVPDAILMTCDGDQRIVGSGEIHMPRPDVVRAMGNDPRALPSGFGALLDGKRLPAGGCMLRAWAYDAAEHKARPVANTIDSRQLTAR